MQGPVRLKRGRMWLGISGLSCQRRLGLEPLTIAEGRRWIEDSLARELSRAQRAVSPLTLVLCQLAVRPLGANVLHQAFVNACKTYLRRYDYVGRVGEDKFILLLPDCDTDAGQQVLHRIFTHVCAATVLPASGRWGINVGMACFPFDGETLVELVQAAHSDLEQGYRSATVASLLETDHPFQEVESSAACPMIQDHSSLHPPQ